MPDAKGYLLSPSLLGKIRKDHDKVKSLGPNLNINNIGQGRIERYLVKITGKYTGSSFTAPLSCTYSGIQVVTQTDGTFDSPADAFIWGNEIYSTTFPPIIDLQSLSAYNQYVDDDALTRIPINSIVEVFTRGDEEGDTRWYTLGATNESFWAKLTSSTSPYSWVALEDDGSTESSRTGSSNATEVNGRAGIPQDNIVRLFPDSQDVTKYKFEFHGGSSSPVKDASLGSAVEHEESARTGVDWNRASQSTYRGFKMNVITGVAYYDSGDQILYCYQQELTFDCNGHLIAVSDEVRVTVDVPEVCE